MSAVPVAALVAALLLCAASPPPRAPFREQPDDEVSGREAARMLGEALPPSWTVSEPQVDLDTTSVTVAIPDAWRGNPIAAAMRVCPAPDSPLWQGVTVYRIVVRYQGHDWPPYDCRP